MKHFPLSACTAMQLSASDGSPCWLRTCDLDSDVFANGAHLMYFPKGDIIGKTAAKHALMGMTFDKNPLWLLDGINDAGLCGGLLMLYEGTSLPSHPNGVIGMELVTRMLAECADTQDVIKKAESLRILDIPHGGGTVPATMHYFFTDAQGRNVILEAADPRNRGKLTAYSPAIGILTNSPPYPEQLDNLQWFLAHSPELAGRDISLNGIRITPDAGAPHLSGSGTFPASYAAYDRFIRAAVLKALNRDGRNLTHEQMLARGYNIMHALFEPHTDGIFHYTRMENGAATGRKDSFTQYIIIYDISRRSLSLRPHDALAWTSLQLTALPQKRCGFSVCRDPEKGILPAEALQ